MTDPAPDYGATGPAALARVSRLTTVATGRTAIGGEKVEVRRYRDECEVDGLNSRGFLTDRQWRAGVRFRTIYRAAVKQPRVCATYGQFVARGATLEASEAQADARNVLAGALDVVPAHLRETVVSIAGENQSPKGRARMLAEALDYVADFFDVPRDYCRHHERATK